jgi:hypothetical protein
MEFKNIDKVLSMIDSINSFKYPMKNQIENNPFSKAWPIPPLYYLAELKDEEIKNWEGKFDAKHKRRVATMDGLVKYTERAKIGEEDIEIELEYYSALEKHIELVSRREVIDILVPVSPYTLQEFVDILYANTNLPPIKSESISEIEAKIDVKNEYNPNVQNGLSKWSIARYYPELHIKLDDEEIVLKYSVVWDTTSFPKFDFYPKRKVLIKYGDFQTETDNEDICKRALEILSSYTIIKGNLISQKAMKLRVNGNEVPINEYIDKIAFNKLTEMYRGISEEINFIQSELNLLKPKVDLKYKEIISLFKEIKSLQLKQEKEETKKKLSETWKKIKAATSPENMELLNKVVCYNNILLSIKNNEKSLAWLGCREASRKYSEIVNLIPRKLAEDMQKETRKIRRIQQLLHAKRKELEKYLIELQPPSYIV